MHGSFTTVAADVQEQAGEQTSTEFDTCEAKFHVTFFHDFSATRRTTDTLSLMELGERVMNAAAREKSKLPWLKLAEFGNKRTSKNSLRHDANVLQISGI